MSKPIPKHRLQPDIQSIALAQLDNAFFNPTNRTTERALIPMRKSLKGWGLLQPIAVVEIDGRYVVADGHRRKESLALMGVKNIMCCVHRGVTEKELPFLWAEMNRITRSVNSREWADVWIRTKGVLGAAIPAPVLANIGECVRVWGSAEEFKRQVLDRGVSPAIIPTIVRLHVILTMRGIEAVPSQREIGDWMIGTRSHTMVKAHILMNANVSKETLRRTVGCIRRNEPLTHEALDRGNRKAPRRSVIASIDWPLDNDAAAE